MSKVIFFVLFFFIASFSFANNGVITENPNLSGITKAMSDGDAAALAGYMDAQLDISILGKEETYTKSQATDALKSFFDKQKPRNFSISHQGTTKGNNAHYCMGSLSGASGNYTVYIYLKGADTNYLIQEIRLDKE
jgi:biopolymer transport protein ExbD